MDRHELLSELAYQIILRGLTQTRLMESWKYRKGKTFDDVRIAVKKGMKRGSGKLEREVMEVAFALNRVIIPK